MCNAIMQHSARLNDMTNSCFADFKNISAAYDNINQLVKDMNQTYEETLANHTNKIKMLEEQGASYYYIFLSNLKSISTTVTVSYFKGFKI